MSRFREKVFLALISGRFFAGCALCVEIGWRLACGHWGKGYAQEGARAALQFGFDKRGLAEIVAFTTINNMCSRNVMEKVGLVYDDAHGDFDHPKLVSGHLLRRMSCIG